jgi:hypothetical protein
MTRDNDRGNAELLVLAGLAAVLVGVIVWGIARIILFMAQRCPRTLAVVILAAALAGGLVILTPTHHRHQTHAPGGFCDYIYCKAA